MSDLITEVLEEVLAPVFQALFRVIENGFRKIWPFGKSKASKNEKEG